MVQIRSHAQFTQPDVFIGNADALRTRLTDEIRAEAARAQTMGGLFGLAVPGGSVAVHCLPILSSLAFDWDRTHIFWVDERAVPPSSPDSNFCVADRLWLTPAGVPSTSIHRMHAEDPDLAEAALAYSGELTRTLGRPARLDLVLLGVGEDGHVASLFPGHAALSATKQLVVPVRDSPKPPARRLTLTLPLLRGADLVVLMALGESKAAIVQKALQHEDVSLPVSLVLQRPARTLVMLDEGAASRL